MKATFEYPLLEIILIQEEDIITASKVPGLGEDQTVEGELVTKVDGPDIEWPWA